MQTITAGWAHIRSVLERRRALDERGATFVEYAMLFAFIAVVCIAAVTLIGSTNAESLSSTASMLP